MAFRIIYICGYIIKLYRKQEEVIQNDQNPNVGAVGQAEAIHRKNKSLILGRSQACDHSGI
jgi:hypothetical protein